MFGTIPTIISYISAFALEDVEIKRITNSVLLDNRDLYILKGERKLLYSVHNHIDTVLNCKSIHVVGERMRVADSLLLEFSAALQFPFHFGMNWNALLDCLSDLDGYRGSPRTFLLISDCETILAEEDEKQKRLFWHILFASFEAYRTRSTNESSRFLKVIAQVETEKEDILYQYLKPYDKSRLSSIDCETWGEAPR